MFRKIIARDYTTFSGKILEKYFRDKCIEQGGITKIGGYWDKSGENEKTAKFIEIKRNEKHIRYNLLKEKTANMLVKTGQLEGYTIEYVGLSLENM